MSSATVGYLYPTRSSELPVIKRNRVHLFKTITGKEPEEAEAKRFELSQTEFILLALLYQTNFLYAISMVDLITHYGALCVFVVFVILELAISMPMLMLFIFMSSYSKRNLIRYWDCVPMFAGLGYTIILTRLLYTVFHITFSAFSVFYIADVIFKPDLLNLISTCSFDNYKVCIPMYPVEPVNLTCPTAIFIRSRNETIYTSMQFYVRNQLMRYDRYAAELGTVDTMQMVTVMCLWLLVFAVSMFGIRRIAKLSLGFQAVCYYIICVTGLYAVTLSGDPIVPKTTRILDNSFEFLVAMTQHSTNTIVISDAIWVGTMKPKSMTAKHAGLLIGILKILMFLLVILVAERSMQLTRGHYKFTDPRCLLVIDYDVFLTFIPDILSRIQFGAIFTFIWFVALLYTNLNTAVYTIIGIVSALAERFDSLNSYRLVTFLVICVSGFLVNIAFCTNMNMAIIFAFKYYGLICLATMVLVFTSLGLMFIYSTKRIIDDYTFTFGTPPNQYWTAAWKTTPIVVMFSFIFMVCELKNSGTTKSVDVIPVLVSYMTCVLFLAPIVAIFLTKCCRHVKYRKLSTVTKPSDAWGPANNIKRQSRKYFFPQRDVRYRNNVLNCTHKCITNSGKFYEENRTQTTKLHSLLQKVVREESEDQVNVASPISKQFKLSDFKDTY